MKIIRTLLISLILITANLYGQDEKNIEKSEYDITFSVDGMVCEGCVEHVQNTLKKVEGVTGYEVKLKENLAIVEFDPKITNADKIEVALKKTNFEVSVKQKEIK